MVKKQYRIIQKNMTTDNTTHLEDIDMLMEPADAPSLDIVEPLPAPIQQHSEPQQSVLAETTTAPRQLDDMERMICHEDFPALLAKATKVKEIRQSMDLDSTAPAATLSTMDPNQVIAAVTRMKLALIGNVNELPVVRKGTYPLTDSMLQESFEVLQKELERCEEWYQQRKKAASGKRKAEVFAVKYAKWQTDLLMTWMIEHKEYPFPTADQIAELGCQTNLTETQIVNWTTNVRKRNLKATVEGGKKPHHFIDFVFLAHDRDKRVAQGLGPAPVPQLRGKKKTGRKKTTSGRRRRKAIPPQPSVIGQPQPNPVPSKPALQPGARESAFRPLHPGGPVGYAPSSLGSMQPPQPAAPNSYQPHIQQPFPPAPYTYHAAAPAGGAWDQHNLAGSMSESFDETPAVTTSNPTTFKHPGTLASSSYTNNNLKHVKDQPQKQQQKQAPLPPTNMTRTDAVLAAAASLEKAMMADPPTPDETASASSATKSRRDSLHSIEMIDLNHSDCFLDDFAAKNLTEI